MTDYFISKLDKRYHHRDLFDCGVDVLNDYLKNRANQEQKKRLNVTYVAVPNNQHHLEKQNVVGYYTLSNSAISRALMVSQLAQGVPQTYDIPTVKIGRLTVDKNYQGQGLAAQLLKNALQTTLDISILSGLRGIEVVAKDGRAASFYAKYGFIKLLDKQDLMFLPIETIVKGMTL